MGHGDRYAVLTHVIESVSRVSFFVTRNERVNEFYVQELSRVLTFINGNAWFAKPIIISVFEIYLDICELLIVTMFVEVKMKERSNEEGRERERETEGEKRVQFPSKYAPQSEVAVWVSRGDSSRLPSSRLTIFRHYQFLRNDGFHIHATLVLRSSLYFALRNAWRVMNYVSKRYFEVFLH